MAVVKTPSICREIASTKEEVEFKAAFFHDVWVARMKRAGKHSPVYHSNPMLTPPPLRGDGKTRCDDCNVNMAPYSELPEFVKDMDREIVFATPKAEEAWRNRG